MLSIGVDTTTGHHDGDRCSRTIPFFAPDFVRENIKKKRSVFRMSEEANIGILRTFL